jgi:hypothetical protein
MPEGTVQTTRDLAAEAFAEVLAKSEAAPGEGDGTEGTPAPAGEATAPNADPSGTEGAPNTEGTDGESAATSEATTPAGDEGTEDVPTEYFGQDLSEFEPEVRKAIIEMVAPRDKHIQKLLRENAEKAGEAAPGETPEAAPAAPAAPAEVSDAEILEALGLNAEDDSPEAKAIIGLAKFNLDLQNEVKAMASKTEVRETEVLWETQLTALEKEYGDLPVDRTEVFKRAVENGIVEPVDAYWRIMGPARQDLMAEVKKRREAATEQLAKGQKPVKPTTSAKTEPEGLESVEVGDAIKEAFGKLTKEHGWTFGSDDDD